MPLLQTSLATFSTVFLLHALYSVHEHQSLHSHPSFAGTKPSLPLDITLELIATTTLLLLSLVLSSSPLRPINWSEWAGRIEREGWDPATESREQFFKSPAAAGLVGESSGNASGQNKGGSGNPWRGLEERRSFWGVREARSEFAEWVRKGSVAS